MTEPLVTEFAYHTREARIVFGTGSISRIPGELERLGCGKALLVTTPGRARHFEAEIRELESVLAGIFDRAQIHVPSEVARAAAAAVERDGAHALIALGGGSAIGVAKAVALDTGLPIIAVPTTYSGSEMTSVWGMSGGGEKRTGRDDRVAPRTVIYDPLLTLDLPPATSAESGVNAVAHCVEALYAQDENPVASLLAEEAVRTLAGALPRIVSRSDDREARARALYGAHLAGAALEATSMGLHHKLCHVLGGMFDLPHALTHAILLPHVTAYNAPFAPRAMERLERALERAWGGSPAPTLLELNRALGITRTLRDLGLAPDDLDEAARVAVARPYPNPGPVEEAAVRSVLESAWEGAEPARRSVDRPK